MRGKHIKLNSNYFPDGPSTPVPYPVVSLPRCDTPARCTPWSWWDPTVSLPSPVNRPSASLSCKTPLSQRTYFRHQKPLVGRTSLRRPSPPSLYLWAWTEKGGCGPFRVFTVLSDCTRCTRSEDTVFVSFLPTSHPDLPIHLLKSYCGRKGLITVSCREGERLRMSLYFVYVKVEVEDVRSSR